MKRRIIPFALCLFLLTSCEKMLMDDDLPATPTATFEYLWQKVNDQYAFFDVKKVDWDSVYACYAPRVSDEMSDDSLFAILAAMLNNLDDGHVNLYGQYDVSHCQMVYTRMYQRRQIDTRVVALHYLGAGYHTTGGFAHNAIANNQVVYIRYSSFSNSAATLYLNYIVNYYPNAKGLILDLRQNGGGYVSNIWNILRLMPQPSGMLYQTQIKSGPGRNEFSSLEMVFAPKNDDFIPYSKPVVVLTDRGSYSATSFFALCAKSYPNMVTIGDTTGGGLGLPNGGQLPNGWYYRFSITRTLAPNGANYENGVPPDEVILLDTVATARGRDNIIDRAVQIILQ